MKKVGIITIIMLSTLAVRAQNDADALRFSQIYYGGTARSLSMGSAFGALGGDFSAISINPAGIGVFRKSEITITPSLNNNSANSTYYGTSYKDTKYNFLLNNFGLVSTFNTHKETGWVSASIGFGYNRINDFNRNITVTGVNPNSSMLDEFVQNASGKYPSQLDAFYEKLALDADVIYNPDTTVVPPQYTYDAMGIWGMQQDQSIVTKGGIGEYNFSFGANYSNKLFLGMALGIQRLTYNEMKTFTETDINGNIPVINSYTFSQAFNTHGSGLSFSFGAIYKPIELLRIGASIHLPTFYSLSSDFSTSMDANFKHVDGFPDNVYKESPVGVYDYHLTTPMRATGSVALVLGNRGLVSMDYEYVDYSTMKLRSDNDSYLDVNQAIQKYYKSASNLRLGGELKFGGLALRGGYALYGSPYAKGYGNDNVLRSSLSAGFGIRSNSFFFDMGYVYTWQNWNNMLYQYYDGPTNYAEVAKTKLVNSQILATFGFRF